jgi:hypothetical protein
VDEAGTFQINLKKKSSRKLNEPVKIDREKVYPMMTLVDNNGEIYWDVLKKTEKFIDTMRHNFVILNEKDPDYKKLREPDQFDVLHKQNIYQSMFTFQKMVAIQRLDPNKHRDLYDQKQQVYSLFSTH